MGIESFFNTINRHTLFQNNITSSSVNEPATCITNGENIYFDFNSIIFNIVSDIEYEINYILYELITGHDTEDKKKYLNKYINLLNLNDFFNNTEIKLTVNMFIQIFDIVNINKILIILIKNKLKDFLTIYNNPELVKNIYISIDGMPNMPKIMEQKKRRHIQHVIGEIKNKIKDKYQSSFDENRKLFNEYYITIEKSNNISQTSFLKFIYDELSSFDYKNDICDLLPNIKSFKISSPHETGEGEKKIMEDITENKYSGSYVIVSPDADLIILSLIQKNILNKKNINNTIQIIRENKNNETIDVIDIDKLMESISNHLEKRIKESFEQLNNINQVNNTFELDMKRIIDDICLLLSLFGNDFMPRIKSLNVRNGFNIIFEVYVRHFTRTRNRYKYITFEEDNMYKINYDNLNSFIYKISENEHKLCIETFASQHYKNYGYINSILESTFGSPYFYDKLNAYVHGFNKLMTYITTNIKENIEINATNIYENLLMSYSDKVVFIKQFIMFEAGINNINNEDEQKVKCIEYINKMIEEIKTYGFYRNKLRFIPYSTTMNDKYHQKIIREEMAHPLMLITNYDEHIYKLENKLDEYHHLFYSDIDNVLGFVDISNRHGFYKLLTDNQIEKNKAIYYEKKMNIKTQEDKFKLVNAYITGMFWTFDFYFNKNNRIDNVKFVSTWAYEYDMSPFIKDIIDYLEYVPNRNKMLNHIFYSINNFNSIHYVPQHLFMNELEQYMYITPYEKLTSKVPQIYIDTLKEANYFMNFDEIINGILNGNAHDYIDCGKSTYLNKCNLLNLRKVNCNDFMKSIISLRNM